LVTIEQLHAELLFKIGDRVADRGCSAPEPAARRRETARLDHRKENGELIEARHPRSRHFRFLERYPQYFMAIAERGERLISRLERRGRSEQVETATTVETAFGPIATTEPGPALTPE
jgi:hypothetical protein